MNSLQGHLLVASPHLGDLNFYRTVVLMIRHDDDGAIGVVLNRPLPETLRDVWRAVSGGDCDSDQPLHLGGPVGGTLIALHADPQASETIVIDGLFVATDRHHLQRLVTQNQFRYRLFSGYSGWAGGQLEGELETGSWLTTPATADHAFQDCDELWKSVASRIGLEILGGHEKLKTVPECPWLN